MGIHVFNARNGPFVNTTKMQFALTGGGVKSVASDRSVAWSRRFFAISLGKGRNWTTDGRFEILMPPDGTVIPSGSGGTGVTVTSGRIPMPLFSSLWYVLPLGRDKVTRNDNFRITDYLDPGTWDTPDHWILLATRNEDANGTPPVKWGTGEFGDYWRPLSLLNGWVNYGEEWATAAYRAGGGGLVEVRGLVRWGTANHVATLPAGYRPSATLLTVQNQADTFNRIDVRANGEILRLGSGNNYITLNVVFHADQ
ncbi:hypothetical protein ALI22I_33985 [Saccharothrix sp. ALI-22-I]|uniref:hypothetical protein n=1 Tax=Saccharothrix sp. ALI-22-I TaxID=1933778 RepID=UPI00097C5E77|nr:hypothetical protein [Saccharothrix sp. ALI-22-I]ONI83506.1 hypothetical protein ALI22I_33985 [Saccharothrix sp. ALI-22-I]